MLAFVNLQTSSSKLNKHAHMLYGKMSFDTGERLEQDLFKKTLEINLHGAFYAVQAAARQMATQGHGGSIIGISSISALVGGAGQTHYTPTKAGVLSLMQSCACALGKYGIRCNSLLPGTIKTQLNEKDLADPQKQEYMEGRIPLGRTGVPEDLAGPAVFLASNMSEYVVSHGSGVFK
jgi:L-rhamnose 1-dehydrogenase